MNIFFLSLNPILCAAMYCDQHVGKILIEIAQMLSVGVHLLHTCDFDETRIYRKTHGNHPMSKWVRSSPEAWFWTVRMGQALSQEWQKRYNKTHKSSLIVDYIATLPVFERTDADPSLSSIPLCMPDEYKTVGDPIQSYINYYKTKSFARWKRTEPPSWFPLVTSK